jgi:formiminoglutamase
MTPDDTLLPPGGRQFRDRFETKVADWMVPWDGRERLERLDVGFVGVPLSKASISHSGASSTPAAVRELFSALTTYDVDRDVDLQRLVARDLGDVRVHPTDLGAAHASIGRSLTRLYETLPPFLPVIVGGDHSVTAPSLAAFARRAAGRVGLVQLDAHMDVRNLEDGGATNGTPLRTLLESGVIDGRHVAQVGLHAFANAKPYRDYARAHGVTQITAREVAREGIARAIERALAAAAAGTAAVYVTFDVDVVAQAFAPGVAALVPGGLSAWDALEAMSLLGAHPLVRALDVVEIDSTQDWRRSTARLALHAILTFLVSYAERASGQRGA